MSEEGAVTSTPEVATSLSRGTNWWGAFVIGLAGTILVTGIVPFAVSSMGAAAIPAIALVVIIGLIVCLCMGELAAMLPHRTGGMPSYAYESFVPLGKKTAKHIGGVSGWGYWLGWFPVAPINMLLAAGYIAVLFHVPLGRTLLAAGQPGHTRLHRCPGHHHRGSGGALRALLSRHPAGRHLCHHPRSHLHGAADLADHPPGLQAQHLPLVQHLGLSFRRSRRRPGSSSSWPGSSSSPGTPSPWRRRPVTSASVATRPVTPRSP